MTLKEVVMCDRCGREKDRGNPSGGPQVPLAWCEVKIRWERGPEEIVHLCNSCENVLEQFLEDG